MRRVATGCGASPSVRPPVDCSPSRSSAAGPRPSWSRSARPAEGQRRSPARGPASRTLRGMTRSSLGRAWHIVTLVVAVAALVLQLILILLGQNILDSSSVTTGLPEQVRRYFSYFTIQSNLLVAISMFMLLTGRTGSQLFRVLRLASLIGITVTGIVAAVALPPSPNYTTANLICDRLLHIVVPLLTFIGWIAFGPRGFVTRSDILPTLI